MKKKYENDNKKPKNKIEFDLISGNHSDECWELGTKFSNNRKIWFL